MDDILCRIYHDSCNCWFMVLRFYGVEDRIKRIVDKAYESELDKGKLDIEMRNMKQCVKKELGNGSETGKV